MSKIETWKEFANQVEWITHPNDAEAYVIDRGPCGPIIRRRAGSSHALYDPNIFDSVYFVGPAAALAKERLKQEQEKDRQAGITYPDRCAVPTS